MVTIDGGSMASSQVTFHQCGYGVEADNSVLTVQFTKMEKMSNGISVLGAVNRSNKITDNTIQADKFGIKVNNVTGLAAYLEHNIITNNGITPLIKTMGIQVANTIVPYQSLSINRNLITLSEGAAGINLINNANLWAYDNDVNMSSSLVNGNAGIRIEGGNLNKISCNNMDGTAGGPNGNRGIYALHADRSSFTCNFTQNTKYGLRFEGVLIGGADANIGTNTMKNNGVGLYYGDGAITGPQKHQGNKWIGTGALHTTPLAALQSLYTVDADENPEFLPNAIIPTLWFSNLHNLVVTPVCPLLTGCPSVAIGLQAEDTDRKIAKAALLAGDYTFPTNWLAQRRLYTRLTVEGNPYLGDTDFDKFINSAQNSGLASYSEVEASIKQLFAIRPADVDSLQTWENRIRAGLDRIEKLNSLLSQPGISSDAVTQYTSERTDKEAAITTLDATHSAKLDALQNARLEAVPAIIAKNNTLTGNEYYQQYEKVVNDIFLHTVASGIYVFSATQYTLLDSIARQCPLSRGEAVVRARALLAIVQDEPVNYDNETACLPANREGNQTSAPGELRIYPNPATDMLTIEYPASEPAELIFFNSVGQQVLHLPLAGKQIRQLEVSAIPPGIYYYILRMANHPVNRGKLIISK